MPVLALTVPSSSNRREQVIWTRLRLGHIRLTHRHLLLGEPPPYCEKYIDDMIKVLQLIYDKYELYTSMKKEKFDILVNLVLKENFIAFDQNLYKQIKGLPQGGPASTLLDNC
ncbi:hypothetical protein TNCV_3023961 [Trichonephila clavipes]|nr:hypothetical protein TNCV_3023961 [Trichonephila clavipes]